MKKIKLSKGKFTLVDDSDFGWLNQWKWCCDSKGYASRSEKISETGRKKRKFISMAREIMKTPNGIFIDHKNHDKLDNRKINLRNCSASDNMRNRVVAKNCKSGYKGVWWNNKRQRWVAYIKHSGRSWILKHCKTKEEAAEVYNREAKKLFKEFSYPNKVKYNDLCR